MLKPSITIKLEINLLDQFNKKIEEFNKEPLNSVITKSSVLRDAIINFVKNN